MTYTVLESHAYDNLLVTKYFCTTTNFSLKHVHTEPWPVQSYPERAILKRKPLFKLGFLSERNVFL